MDNTKHPCGTILNINQQTDFALQAKSVLFYVREIPASLGGENVTIFQVDLRVRCFHKMSILCIIIQGIGIKRNVFQGAVNGICTCTYESFKVFVSKSESVSSRFKHAFKIAEFSFRFFKNSPDFAAFFLDSKRAESHLQTVEHCGHGRRAGNIYAVIPL